jgi:hypothetical protein
MGYPRALPDYTLGTVTVTNGSRTVTGAGTLWQDGAGEYQLFGGDYLRVGNQRPIMIESVDSATSLTLVEPWPHTTAANTAYRAPRYVPLPSSQVVWAINQVLSLLGNNWVSTGKIIDKAVTYEKIQDVTGGKVLGRLEGAAGAVQELPISVNSSGEVRASIYTVTDNFKIFMVGATQPSVWFQNNGSRFTYDTSDGTYYIMVAGNIAGRVNAGGFVGNGSQLTGVSDRRVKSDITPIDPAQAESIVMGLPAVTFTMDGAHRHGFIADDVAVPLPEIVSGEPDAVDPETGEPILQGLKLDQTPFIAPLWAHVQALTERVRALEAAQP